MTEQEWLESKDPQAMLKAIDLWNHTDVRAVSDRKLRLFACACCYGVSAELGKDAEQCAEWKSGPAKNAANWATVWAGDQKQPTSAEKAHILRDIIGSPFQPVEPLRQSGGSCGGQGLEDLDWQSPWLTPTVLAIAQAAYDERPGRKCEKCGGAGEVENDTGGNVGTAHCLPCHSTGRISDGSLDPVTLGILADALEDAGCVDDSKVFFTCENAGKHSHAGHQGDVIHGVRHDMNPQLLHHHHDEKCQTLMREGLLSHLRSPGPHVRGCWAVDLILGLE